MTKAGRRSRGSIKHDYRDHRAWICYWRKRRNEKIPNVITLDELWEKQQQTVFQVSRNGVYIRLLPKRRNSEKGKRKVVTVPIKLIRARNDKHDYHVDGIFFTATIRILEEIASLLGTNQVFPWVKMIHLEFLSDYQQRINRLSFSCSWNTGNFARPWLDHCFTAQTCTFSYAGIVTKVICFDVTKADIYPAPIFVAIWSGKHSTSSASSYVKDLETLSNLLQF